MKRVFILFILSLFLTTCSPGGLQIDATDYVQLLTRAEQEHKNVIVLVTSTDCDLCHRLQEEWTTDREWQQWQKEQVLLCHIEFLDTANIFSALFNTMAVPLVAVLAPTREVLYVHSGFITASRLKAEITRSQSDDPGPSRLNNSLYTASTKDLYRLFSDVLAVQFELQQPLVNKEQVFDRLQHALQIEPYFMNRYLEWKYYILYGKTAQADSCRKMIFTTLSDDDKLLYITQIRELDSNFVPPVMQKLFPKDYRFEWSEQEREIELEIPYENQFDKPLIILSVGQSCNCLKTFWSKEPLAPHEKQRIRVIYRNKGEGFFRKTIRIYTNDNGSPYEITLQGQLKK